MRQERKEIILNNEEMRYLSENPIDEKEVAWSVETLLEEIFVAKVQRMGREVRMCLPNNQKFSIQVTELK